MEADPRHELRMAKGQVSGSGRRAQRREEQADAGKGRRPGIGRGGHWRQGAGRPRGQQSAPAHGEAGQGSKPKPEGKMRG